MSNGWLTDSMNDNKYFETVENPNTVVTAIDSTLRFPEILEVLKEKYKDDINTFIKLINESDSSSDMLWRIRSKDFNAVTRMSLLKMFRRCVSPVLDTETTKKIQKVSTDSLVDSYGHTFKSIHTLKAQFNNTSQDLLSALAALIGEYDTRGQLGYQLTDQFFNWFEEQFHGVLIIDGPRGAGKDIELSSIFPEFEGSYPCDFVIREAKSNMILAVGFARYDSTRGGAQSDDRTSGNSNKVEKAMRFFDKSGIKFKILFLSDGPGLTHNDTWKESCELDGCWDGNVRVTTLKTAKNRVSIDWILGTP